MSKEGQEMAGPPLPPVAKEYIEEKGIYSLMEDMADKVLREKPANPVEFMLQYLQEGETNKGKALPDEKKQEEVNEVNEVKEVAKEEPDKADGTEKKSANKRLTREEGDWKEYYLEDKKKYYYTNKVTKKSTWKISETTFTSPP
eukprot:Sspe_Gene.17048::Locus_6042_Transcript_1_1_Confidence_1.000_Length_770::g.17048::m.17048